MGSRALYLFVYYSAWLIPVLLDVATLVAMYRRKLTAILPFFFGLVVYRVVSTPLLLTTRQLWWRYYFLSYYGAEALQAILVLLVIQELFGNAFRPYNTLAQAGRLLFQTATIVMVMTAAVVVILHPGHELDVFVGRVFSMKRIVGIVEAGLILFLFAMRWLFAIPLRHYLFGITVSLATSGLIELAAFAARAAWGDIANSTMRWVVMSGDNCTAAMWLVACLTPAPAIALSQLQRERLLGWDTAARVIVRRWIRKEKHAADLPQEQE